jgi:hypothetical protein
VRPNEITEVLNRPISQELLARDVTRLAYVAKDGTPRNVPIIFTWNGAEIVMCTTKNAPKLPALRKNPMVALTIDTEVHPDLGEADRLRDDAAERGRGTHPAAGRTSARLSTARSPTSGGSPTPLPVRRGRGSWSEASYPPLSLSVVSGSPMSCAPSPATRRTQWSALARICRVVGSLATGVPENSAKEIRRRCRIGAEVFVAGVRPPARGGAKVKEPRS